jgi:cytochrome c oxidase subunit II
MSPRIFIPSDLDDMFVGWPPPIFDPVGPYAGSITFLTWVLLAMAVAVLLLVLTALWIAFRGEEATRKRLGGTTVIWAGGIVLPIVVLTALLIWGLRLTASLSEPKAPQTDIRIQVTGEMWWWRVAYMEPDGQLLFWDANEIHIPVGRTIQLELRSGDVIHSLWVPRLSGKVDMIPGRTNVMNIQADRPGIFGGHCAEYCGGPHALMGIVVVAHEPREFARFVARSTMRERAQLAAGGPGANLFRGAGCAACHRIAGTEANGMVAPDLTFVGRRQTLGSGILPNNTGTMMGWIADSHAIKPGNRMPPYKVLSAEELSQLAAYLEQQR